MAVRSLGGRRVWCRSGFGVVVVCGVDWGLGWWRYGGSGWWQWDDGEPSVGGSTSIVGTESRVGFAKDGSGGCDGDFVAEGVVVVGERVLLISDPRHQGFFAIGGGGETVNRQAGFPFVVR